MKIQFYLRFFTQYGQSLSITGNCDALGNNDLAAALPMQYLTDEFWTVSVELGKDFENDLQYSYILKNENGEDVQEWGNDRSVEFMKLQVDELTLIDTWNHAGEFENTFFTQPFKEVLLPKCKEAKTRSYKNITHIFKVKAPLLKADEVMCIAGSNLTLKKWSKEEPVLMQCEGDWWTARIDLSAESFPVAYKYGVFNIKEKNFAAFEAGNNRILYDSYGRKKITILHDGFAQLPNDTWKAAGVAIPVFSLRTEKSFGVGEFTDIKALVDWAKNAGMKLIQILPVNDTTANHNWQDSYPYAAISAFALHPVFLNLETTAGKASHPVIKSLKKKQAEFNALPEVDYEAVMKAKWAAAKELYHEQKKAMHEDAAFFEFFELNRHWLVPYAAFSYLRDKYKTPDFSLWKAHSVYDEHSIQQFVAPSQKHYDEVAIYYFIQFHLHLQLLDATNYAHANGIIVKGDIPIGIYRNSCDAWMEPELYNMSMQAGAPPDDFAVKGQNWGFPTYNWQRMAENDFKWWRQRFEQMSNYFDAFRIDHILGFFRIWSIPMHAVEGILGYFVPALPVHINEFGKSGLWFDYQRYCKPFINDDVLRELMHGDTEILKPYLDHIGDGQFALKDEFNTQRKVEAHFAKQEENDVNDRIKHGLYDCISNVILFEVEGSQSQQFHFRISMGSTSSFRFLDEEKRRKLDDLYVNYFYRRQDDFWRKEAMAKLPYLKRSTNMLVCGEDLGMVPECVPDVMKQLGMLSLEIQRMPKDSARQFFHPKDAPYMSVVTPSTHDMSTIRGWWEENRTQTQKFYTHELGQTGEAPYYCEPWIVTSIIKQHLYSPAMWSIFQIQELLGMNAVLRRENPNEERINVPANPKHYWRYRMHLSFEQLMKEEQFNGELKEMIVASGRG
ncbi:MAG: 4-alpha-glucanotransferase [Chitinophagaceae bacterium]|nr:4-alpha-glucanotransferase [Chitinophagaceae bacterium]